MEDARLDALLFGESHGRCHHHLRAGRGENCGARQTPSVPAQRIGTVGGKQLKLKTPAGEHAWEVAGLHDLWWNSIGNAMA